MIMKKWIAVMLTSLLLICSMLPVFGDGADIKISTEIGFDKVYRSDFVTPVTITVENNMKDINGEIQIEIPSSMGPMGVDMVDVYAISINHPKNTTKKYAMNIPIPSSLLNTKIRIIEGKNTVTEQYMRIDRGIAENVMLAGIMSDNTSNLNYLNGFTFKNLQGSVGMKIANLNEENFSTDLDVMSSFNIIFMNDYDSTKISDEQYKTLKRWVEQGGFLIIGTGPNGSKTLSAFKDDFITGERGDLINISGKTMGEMAGGNFEKTLDVMDIKLAQGETVLAQDGVGLAQYVNKGKGRVLLLSFDMGLEPLTSWSLNRNFMEALVQRAAPAVYAGQYFKKYMAVARNNYYLMDRALMTIPELSLPSYKMIIIIFAIYILLAAPVTYIILKKRDRRELMWAVVPLLSMVFMAVIYFMGFGTRLTGPILNKVSIIYGDETGSLVSKSFGGVFTPNKTDLIVEGVEGTKVKPLIYRNYHYGSSPTWNEGRKIETKIMVSPKSVIEFNDVGVWTMKTLSLDNNEEIKGAIISEINYVDSDFRGFIENSTDFDLEDCYIITSNEYMSIGDIKSGERKEIAGETKKYYGNRYDLLNNLYDIDRLRNEGLELSEEESVELRKQYQKRYILEYFLDYNTPSQIEGVKLIGWSPNSVGGNVKVNGKAVDSYEKSLLIADLKLIIQSGEEVELPWGYIKPIIKQNLTRGSYEPYDNMIYGAGTIEVAYSIRENIIPSRIGLSHDRIEPNVKQYIWNVEKNQWESGDFTSHVIQGDDIAEYLDKNNTLLLKYELNDNSFRLPQITVKGRVK
jgi:hypothetical protein